MPNLETMHLDCETGFQATVIGPVAPRLHTLRLTRPLKSGQNLTHLTRLHIDFMRPLGPEMASLVNQIDALEELHIDGGRSRNSFPQTPWTANFHCPHLTTLSLANGDTAFPPEILTHLEAPNLETIYLSPPWMDSKPLSLSWDNLPKSNHPSVKRLVIPPSTGFLHYSKDPLLRAYGNYLVERFPDVVELEAYPESTLWLCEAGSKPWSSLSVIRIRVPSSTSWTELQNSLLHVWAYIGGGGSVAKVVVEAPHRKELDPALEELRPLAHVEFTG